MPLLHKQKEQTKKLKKTVEKDYYSYLVVIAAYAILLPMQRMGFLSSTVEGFLIPSCYYIVMALSLNLVVGVMGDLSLGHAGFMSLGAFSGVIASQSLLNAVPNPTLRLLIAMAVGAVVAGLGGFLIGIPVLRLRGDYLAIVTLAFGEIIKVVINLLLVWKDGKGLHILFNYDNSKSMMTLNPDGTGTIIDGAQGATSTVPISTFTAGIVLVLFTLFVILNFVHSRTGRAVLAIRDNRIAAEASGINVMKNKMIAFVISTTLAGMAGVLYGLNTNGMAAKKFDFNLSIMILVFVVLGGLGNMLGSVIAATVLYILPEALRDLQDYRMLMYSIVLILIMLGRNSPQIKALLGRILPGRKSKEDTAPKSKKNPKPKKEPKAKKGKGAAEA